MAGGTWLTCASAGWRGSGRHVRRRGGCRGGDGLQPDHRQARVRRRRAARDFRPGSGGETARGSRIQAATLLAASVPLRTAAAAAEVARLAGQLPGRSSPGVLSDVAVAAAVAAAAIEAAAVNIEINLAALKPREAGAQIARQLDGHLAAAAGSHALAERLRREISK